MRQVIHIPQTITERTMKPFDPREQPVRARVLPHYWKASDAAVQRAKEERDRERREVELSQPDEASRRRIRALFTEDRHISKEWATVLDYADMFSRKRFNVPCDALSITQRATLLRDVESMLRNLDEKAAG